MEVGKLKEEDLLDPNPDIHALFCHYNELYFRNALGACTVDWSSKRMTLCAGVCHYMKMGGCAIRLSEPLLKFRSSTDFKNTLLHEMIHAYLWLTNGNRDHDDHGPFFQKVMKEINTSIAPDHQRPAGGYAITIYHSFTDEVNNYRVHHWKCQICGDLIKRAMNRQPSASDCMRRVARNELCDDVRCYWHQHRRTCGGEYIKIAEPPGYQDKGRHAKSTGKRDHEGKKDGTIMRKLNKSNSVADVMKKGNVTSALSHQSPLIESFYPKFKKEKVNSSLDECPVPDQKDSEDDSEEVLIFKRRKRMPEEKSKACSSSTPAPEVEQIVHKGLGLKRQQSDNVVGSGTCENDFNVIIKWKDWYAFEEEDDEAGVEPLVNKRQERRRQEKMLKHAKIQTGDSADVPMETTRCEDYDENAHNHIFEAGRNTLSLSDSAVYKTTPVDEIHPQISLMQTDLPRLDNSSNTGMVKSSSSLKCVSANLNCSGFCTSGCNKLSLSSNDGMRIEACLEREGSYPKDVEKLGFQPPISKPIPTSVLEVTASHDLVTMAKSSDFLSRCFCVKEQGKTSTVVYKKEMLHEALDLDRVIDDLIQLDDTPGDDVSSRVQSIENEKNISIRNSFSKNMKTPKGGSSASDNSLEISDSLSKEDCLEKLNSADFTKKVHERTNEVGEKRIGTFHYLNGKSKREQTESRPKQIPKSRDDGLSAVCPVCGDVLEGDIHEADFNRRFNIHLDNCFGSHD